MSTQKKATEDFLRELVNGYYAGENVTQEIKKAWVAGFCFGLKLNSEEEE